MHRSIGLLGGPDCARPLAPQQRTRSSIPTEQICPPLERPAATVPVSATATADREQGSSNMPLTRHRPAAPPIPSSPYTAEPQQKRRPPSTIAHRPPDARRATCSRPWTVRGVEVHGYLS